VTGQEIVFIGAAVLAGASALLAVTSPRVVHSALWLVVCLGSLAGVYLVLGAEVVALVQLLVYVGAVVVLVLFALMLTRAPIEPSRNLDASLAQRAAAAVAAIAVAAILAGTLLVAVGDQRIPIDAGRGEARDLGLAIFGGWVLPFELLSVLLLAALIGALAVSRDPGGGENPPLAMRSTDEPEAQA
jgi:NADH-quinone oxidoreductase subunit J